MMELKLVRFQFTEESTIGKLYVNGAFECYTLEDKVRSQKIAGVTAIPEGRYEVEITWSPKYRRLMPLIKNVPGFSGVRIHSGNKAADTEGCVLVGRNYKDNYITESRLAYSDLFEQLEVAAHVGDTIMLTVSSAKTE